MLLGEQSDRLIGERQLFARAPLIGDVVDDQRGAHAFDGTLLEAMISLIRRHEDHGAVGGKGRAAGMGFVRVVNVGAEIMVVWVFR